MPVKLPGPNISIFIYDSVKALYEGLFSEYIIIVPILKLPIDHTPGDHEGVENETNPKERLFTIQFKTINALVIIQFTALDTLPIIQFTASSIPSITKFIASSIPLKIKFKLPSIIQNTLLITDIINLINITTIIIITFIRKTKILIKTYKNISTNSKGKNKRIKIKIIKYWGFSIINLKNFENKFTIKFNTLPISLIPGIH